jgi:hypothetical protein
MSSHTFTPALRYASQICAKIRSKKERYNPILSTNCGKIRNEKLMKVQPGKSKQEREGSPKIAPRDAIV